MAVTWPKLKDLAGDIQAGKTTALEQVQKSLAAIEAHAEYDAIISTTEQRALERAKEIDARIEQGDDVGPLAGVPFIAKDNFLTFGSETTAASNILKGFTAPYQATAVERLEAAGAICVAKANLDAFAHGSSTENSDFMTTKNPHDKSRVPGGSSGGSGTAVVLGLAPFALGTDTGGSIRLPAAFTGCVGLKPTYGLVSRSGVVAMASSTDVIGPLAMTVEDAALVLEVMSGKDELDSTTITRDTSPYTALDVSLKGKKVGVVKEYMTDDVDVTVKEAVQATIDTAKQQGAEVIEVSLPSLPLALAVYYIVCPAEVSSNLSRYDGQHYGHATTEPKDLEASYSQTRSEGFGREAKRRIMIGTYVLSSGFYDAYYKRAQQVRTELVAEFADAFKKVDLLIGPTAPVTAFKIGENIDDPLKMYLIDIMTVSASLVGIPAISVPAQTDNKLPVGVQLMAASGQDRALLSAAKALEATV